jgi:hypothetical protein
MIFLYLHHRPKRTVATRQTKYRAAMCSTVVRKGEPAMRSTTLKIIPLRRVPVSAVLVLAAGLSLPSMVLADRECSAATIRGAYIFNASGYNIVGGVAQPAAYIFTMVFDGLGNMTTPAVSLSRNGAIFSLPQGNPGNYTVDADCRGTLTFSGGTTYDLQIAPNGNQFNMLQTNPGSVTQGTAHRVSRPAR